MTPPPDNQKLTILIASPLEIEQVARIRTFAPDRLEVIHQPDLLPKPRYVADHSGASRTMSPEETARWHDLLARADVLFDFDLLAPDRLPQTAPKLKWVQATSAGIGEFLKRTGLEQTEIAFTTASGVHARPLAEFAMLGLLYFFRDVPGLLRIKEARHWERYTVEGLEGKRVLVVGLGSLGRAVAKDAASFGVEVWGTRRRSGVEAPDGVTRLVDTSEIGSVISEVDGLVLACPLTPQTQGLIGKAEFAAMKRGSVVVNIARGAVIDETALTEALASGRIRGAALDVFAVEPLPKDSKLWELPNVLISPHSASTVAAENSRIVDIFLDNLGRFLDGRPLRNRFDRDRGY